MPRKLYRNIEDMSLPEERPGSGRSRLAETKKNLAAGRAEAASLKALSPKEREAMRLRMQSDEIAEAGAHELEPFFEKATEEFDVAEQRFQIDPSDENEAAMEVAREKASKLNVQINELLPEGRSRRKPSKMLAHEAFVAKHEDRGLLLAEQASLKDRMQEMGGVWGGESYFILNDRLEEIERALRKMETGSEARQKVKPVEVEKLAFASEPTAQDRLADAHKTIKQMKRYEREIETRKQKVVDELKRHGISNAQLPAELARLTPELREATTGVKPSFLERIKTGFLGVAHGLAGIERPRQAPEVRALLEKYVEIETEKNVEFHKRADAQHELEAAEVAAGKARVSGAGYSPDALAGSGSALEMSGFLETATGLPAAVKGNIHVGQELEALKNIEQGSVQQELAAVRALKLLSEEVQDDMMNFAGRKDAFTFEDGELYKDKLQSLKQRLSALDEGAGDSEAAKNAAHEAREMYDQYRRQVSQAAAAIVGQARSQKPDRVRPPSLISTRARATGSYGTSIPGRREASLLKMETADKKERAKAEAKERVNRDVQVYRSEKWRKDLIDGVNADESVRPAMHAVYEAYKKRVQEMMAKGELNLITHSPDPALDYTLDMYRLYARKESGKHAFNEKLVSDASAGVTRVNELLGGKWDEDGATDRLVRALLREKPTLTVAENDTEEMELDESDFEEVQDSETVRKLKHLKKIEESITSVPHVREPANDSEESLPFPLARVKRFRSDEEEVKSELEEIPTAVEVPPVSVPPVVEQKVAAPIEVGPTLSVEEMTARLRVVKKTTLDVARGIVGLGRGKNLPQEIAKRYGELVKDAARGKATAAKSIRNLHRLLKINFEVVKPMDREAKAAFEASLTEVRPEQYEAMRTASDALDNEFRKVFSLAKNVVPETFIEGEGKGAWMDAAAGERMRHRIDELKGLVITLPEGDDFRVLGLSKIEIFTEFVNGALRKHAEMNKVVAPRVVPKETARVETAEQPETVEVQEPRHEEEARANAREAARLAKAKTDMSGTGVESNVVDLQQARNAAKQRNKESARRAKLQARKIVKKDEK